MPDQKFQIIAKKCPWRKPVPKTGDFYCTAIQRSSNHCTETNCAPWHFIIGFQNKG